MIVIYLKGGLGNQMFQYAFGRHLAEIHGTVVKMDTSAYDDYAKLDYVLDVFNVQGNFASEDEIRNLKETKASKFQLWFHDLLHSHPLVPKSYVRANFSHFDPKILRLPDNVYVEGYFNSEKYFLGIEEIIRREFVVKTPQSGRDKELSDMIADCNSVSIHIRRGDYVADPTMYTSHGACGIDYYNRCVESLCETVKDPHFFVFSDDPQWSRDNLKLGYPAVFVDHNDMAHGHEDMRLMSQCKHNIIANSTFSWWGAWLNTNKDKRVFAPDRWFVRENKSSDDIIPVEWVRK